VTTNVATYTFSGVNIYSNWAVGNSITVTGFSGGDAFFNQTCTLTAVTTSSVSCALTHANASSTTSGTVTNTSAGPFTAFDAGTGNPNGAKRIFGYGSCAADFNTSASNNNPMVTTATTIAAFVSSTQVTLSQAAGPGSSGAGIGCVIWGNTDDAGAAALDASMATASQCPRGHWAAGNYLFTTPHFYEQPAACQAAPALIGSTLLGNLLYAAGVEFDGRGSGTTVFYLTPSFPETGACNHGQSGVGCFAVPVEGRFSNFGISGGGNFTSANFPAGHNLMEVNGPATLEYFTCTNFGASPGTTVALALYAWAKANFINISG